MYQHSIDYVGKVGSLVDHDITFCDTMVGYRLGTYLEVTEWYEDLRKYLKKKASKDKSIAFDKDIP